MSLPDVMKRAAGVYRFVAIAGLNTLVMLLLVEGLAAGANAVISTRSAPDTTRWAARQDRENVEYYASRPWMAPLWQEWDEAARIDQYEPYLIFKPSPYKGRFVNVGDNGRRVTPGSPCPASGFRIYLFGGSAVFGLWQPDSLTIAALLQQALRDRNIPACVENYGANAYVSTQELISLERALQQHPPPALVLWHDGWNDASIMHENGVPGAHTQLSLVRQRLRQRHEGLRHAVGTFIRATNTYRLARSWKGRSAGARVVAAGDAPDPPDPAKVDAVVRTYAENLRIARALAHEYGFRFHAFWQPTLIHSGKPLSAIETRFVDRLRDNAPLIDSVYARVEREAASMADFTYLGSIFDSVRTTIYIDPTHLTPDGNAIVVQRMILELERRGLLGTPRRE
jgi:lysophospholipase L1-like esterase